ncbi:hypothetical protein HY478_03165 [Candidatus Uhrbacteria bacterium]|nr:hypothetical protein [Candidatus Uhrbacteria bacterium]
MKHVFGCGEGPETVTFSITRDFGTEPPDARPLTPSARRRLLARLIRAIGTPKRAKRVRRTR